MASARITMYTRQTNSRPCKKEWVGLFVEERLCRIPKYFFNQKGTDVINLAPEIVRRYVPDLPYDVHYVVERV